MAIFYPRGSEGPGDPGDRRSPMRFTALGPKLDGPPELGSAVPSADGGVGRATADLDALFSRYYEVLVKSAIHRYGIKHYAAEDLVQDAFERICRNWRSDGNPYSEKSDQELLPILRTAMSNLAINEGKAHGRVSRRLRDFALYMSTEDVSAEDAGIESFSEGDSVLCEAFGRALDQLPKETRKVAELTIKAELSCGEAAWRLKKSPVTVRRQRNWGKEKIKELLLQEAESNPELAEILSRGTGAHELPKKGRVKGKAKHAGHSDQGDNQ